MKYQLIKHPFYIFISIALLLGACYPEGPEYIEEMDMVATRYDPEFDFQSKKTYYLNERIVNIYDESNDENNADPPIIDEEVIFSKVRENMDLFGYVEVDTAGAEDPDIVILMGFWNTTNIGVYCYPYYWYYWWGYWYGYNPGWGYYPWGCDVAYTYTTGTLLIEYTDFNGRGPNGEFHPVRWEAAVNGINEDYESNLEARTERGIDQSFNQSQYLQLDN